MPLPRTLCRFPLQAAAMRSLPRSGLVQGLLCEFPPGHVLPVTRQTLGAFQAFPQHCFVMPVASSPRELRLPGEVPCGQLARQHWHRPRRSTSRRSPVLFVPYAGKAA